MILRRRSGLLLATGLFALLFGGCLSKSSTKPNPGPDLYVPQDSPANVLANFMTAYTNRDLGHYSALFSPDFTFVFSPLDVQNPTNPTPPSWGLTDENTSAGNMFHSSLVDKIELTFVQSVAVSTDSLYPGTWRVGLSNVNLLVYTRQEGTPWIYRVAGGTGTFFFKEVAGARASNGKPLWVILRWEDQPIAYAPLGLMGPATKESTWGSIKHLYN